MGLLSLIKSGISAVAKWNSLQGYDAVRSSGKRKPIAARTQGEDAILTGVMRSRLIGTSQDLVRNFAVVAWAIRKHADYVASFDFHSRTGNVQLDLDIERLMDRDSRSYYCDAGARFSREKMFRNLEIRRIVDGDVLPVKLSDGRIQVVESDRIRNPEDTSTGTWVSGVKIEPATGRPLAFGIFSRGERGYGFNYSRTVGANNTLGMYGFFDRFTGDQTRGISPLASAINSFQDVHENISYALAKAKVSQLFALVFSREADDAAGEIMHSGEENVEGDPSSAGYSVDFGRGPVQLDLNAGDKADFLESRNPSSEFQAFNQQVLMIALKALDIPFSFFDESHTNYSGARGSWLQYERSCKSKQQDQIEIRNRYTIWRLQQWIINGELTLPSGWTIENVNWEWVAISMPWFDPARELNADLSAISAGIQTPQRLAKQRGAGDFYENVDEIAKAMDYARSKGVPLQFAANAAAAVLPPDLVPTDVTQN